MEENSIQETEIVILGGGPAGASAAIWARRCGLDVMLLDCSAANREKPGETLHPGIEPVLERLGVLRRVSAAGFIRHEGYWIERDGQKTFSPYGSDAGGSWRGFQVNRRCFDGILAESAAEAGARFLRPVRVRRPLIHDGRVCGLELDGMRIRSRFVIDAGGGSHWLACRLRLPVRQMSRRLIAQYGYTTLPVLGDGLCPLFRWERGAWTWGATVSDRQNAIVHLDLSGGRATPDYGCPIRFRGANVTWRMVEESAGAGYFLVGDAASVLDPAASHGVLRAVMSGMLAADLIAQARCGDASEPQIIAAYRDWITRWFRNDAMRLRELYVQLGWPSGIRADRLF